MADDETRLAQRVRQALLGATNSNRFDGILRLFEALLREGRSPDPRAGTKRLDDGISVECRDQSATLSADEARWVATGLELVAQEEDWPDRPADLIAYLRDGAKVLDGTLSTREMAARHELWDR